MVREAERIVSQPVIQSRMSHLENVLSNPYPATITGRGRGRGTTPVRRDGDQGVGTTPIGTPNPGPGEW